MWGISFYRGFGSIYGGRGYGGKLSWCHLDSFEGLQTCGSVEAVS